MKLHRVLAVTRRYAHEQKRNFSRMSELFYWPVMDLLQWGLSTGWHQSVTKADVPILMTMLACILLWQILWRSNQAITMGLVAEIWDKNLCNLFSTPLSISEWIVGVMLVGVGQTCIAGVIGYLVALLFFGIDLTSLGLAIVPLVAGVVLFGWTVGVLSSAVVLRFGNSSLPLLWIFASLSAPFSGVYFPVAMLPGWIQPASSLLPSTYLFEGARTILRTGEVPGEQLLLSLVLNVVYLSLALYLLRWAFELRRQKGLQQ